MTFFLHEARYRDLTPAAERLVTICGAGALGANLAETLARMGLRRLRVIDRDRVEAHNLSTQPWIQQDIGGLKARVLANALYRAVGTRVEAQPTVLTADNASTLLSGGDVVVDAFDNLPSRAAVSAAAAALDIPCLHIALGDAGDYGCGLWDGAYTIRGWELGAGGWEAALRQARAPNSQLSAPNPHAGCDYPLTRPLVLLVVAAAAEVLAGHLIHSSRRNFECTLRDLHLSTS